MKLLGNELKITRENWKKSAQELIYSIILGLLPMWMGAVLIVIFAPNSNLGQLIEYRHFIIFSTALLATGFFCVGQEFKKVPFPGRTWFLFGLIILMAFATAMFSGTTTGMAEESSLRIVSIILFVLSALFVFFVLAINKAQVLAEIQGEDVLGYHADEMKEFREEFDKLGAEKLEGDFEKLEEEEKSNDK